MLMLKYESELFYSISVAWALQEALTVNFGELLLPIN